MPDLAPGTPPDARMFRDDPRRLLGNAIAISHANGEFSYYGCLQQASAQVKEGEMIRRGARLGRVGNSGNSPGPHLHFHLMEGPNPFIDQGLPLKFSHFSAGGQTFTEPMTIPSRMIIFGPPDTQSATEGTQG
jgi:murein DD-endopeptidase MepM/ murein hydrolase activator NlpD